MGGHSHGKSHRPPPILVIIAKLILDLMHLIGVCTQKIAIS